MEIFIDYRFGIQLPGCSKLTINQKNANEVLIFRHHVISIFFFFFISLIKFGCWSKFHVNNVTSSGVMTILFYKRLTKNPEIGNNSVWGLLNNWRLGRVRDTKFGTNVSNKMLLNVAKCQSYSFYRF